jgi:Aerobic-type carbon monoxide dehydrogenase, small subunit CoxS/CutS homologs
MQKETIDVHLTVNGEAHDLCVEPRELLSQTLRERLGYTEINIGCESSICGACTVHSDGKSLKSCTRLTAQADGAQITTVSGVDDDAPLKTAFTEEHALQCGYCTPGMIMVLDEFLDTHENPSREVIRSKGLRGNLCRCTGYDNIVDAVETAADTREDG